MAEVNEVAGYGYVDDEEQVNTGSSGSFGLNECFMTKFEHISNAGKDGAEGEALDIVFNIDGKDKSYRVFPVTKAFKSTKDGGGEVTDPRSPEMKEAFKNFNAIMTHILHCFVEKEAIVIAFGRPVRDFKDYCNIAKGLLPTNFAQVPLQIFLQYQWAIKGENKRTFLEIPKTMKHGRWLTKAIPAQGEWIGTQKEDPTDNDQNALTYKDAQNNIHPFTRNGWFVKSNFANVQKEEGAEENAINAIPANIPAPEQGNTPAAGTSPATDTNGGW